MGAYCSGNLAVSGEFREKAVAALEEAGFDDFETSAPKRDGSIMISWDGDNRSYDFCDDVLQTLEKAGIPETAYMFHFCFMEGDPDDEDQFFGRFHGESAPSPVIHVGTNRNPFIDLAKMLEAYYDRDQIAAWKKEAEEPRERQAAGPR